MTTQRSHPNVLAIRNTQLAVHAPRHGSAKKQRHRGTNKRTFRNQQTATDKDHEPPQKTHSRMHTCTHAHARTRHAPTMHCRGTIRSKRVPAGGCRTLADKLSYCMLACAMEGWDQNWLPEGKHKLVLRLEPVAWQWVSGPPPVSSARPGVTEGLVRCGPSPPGNGG
jgi:hypothetical protein